MANTASRAEILASLGQRGAAICEQTHLLTQLSVPAVLDMSQRDDGREKDSVLHTEHFVGLAAAETGSVSTSLTLRLRHIEPATLCSPSNKPVLAVLTETRRSDTILATAFSSVLVKTATSFALWRASLVVLCLTGTTGVVCNSKTLCWILRQASPSA